MKHLGIDFKTDQVSVMISLSSFHFSSQEDVHNSRRRTTKFKALTGDGKPLGDRELILKKQQKGKEELDEEETFDRYSSVRRTLNKGSFRRKDSELDNMDVNAEDKKLPKVSSDWRNKLANKFKKNSSEHPTELVSDAPKAQNGSVRRPRVIIRLYLISLRFTILIGFSRVRSVVERYRPVATMTLSWWMASTSPVYPSST